MVLFVIFIHLCPRNNSASTEGKDAENAVDFDG